uniref:His-Xaa-Ser system radical SAM maturase HxsB n=1 Tax=Desulfobacca acetoxidans TaxID=60893 RepID=A0A7V4G9K5_9BACT
MLVVNDAGEFIFLTLEEFRQLVEYRLPPDNPRFLDLKAKHLLTDTRVTPVVDLLATKYRTKKAFLKNFTGLHIVVVTLRCNQRCHYCHASSQGEDDFRWDMSIKTAKNVVAKIMSTPSPDIKIEFQGGECLLNFEVVKTIVAEAKRLNKKAKKDLSFVVCTNLTLMDDDILAYLKREGISVSTSLDGPREIHDRHRRLRSGGGSYDLFLRHLERTREVLGHEMVNPLATLTRDSLPHLNEIIDEYVRLGFRGIFLRNINPYGYARSGEHQESFRYPMAEFVAAYKKALSYIIDLNLKGKPLAEDFATILLSRILTPFSTGFVDLQSPTGAGLAGVVYDYNGDVYPSDEGRMLAKMGDRRFRMGNVNTNTYLELFTSPVMQELVGSSCVETLPGCHACALQMYCGADPIRNYAMEGALVGHQPTSDFCEKHKSILEHLLMLLDENNPEIMDVFWSWITNRPLAEVRGGCP